MTVAAQNSCRLSAPPVCVPFLDGPLSYGHMILGAALPVIKSPGISLLVTLAFLIYQIQECEPLPNKIGDFAEFAAGYLASAAVGEVRP